MPACGRAEARDLGGALEVVLRCGVEGSAVLDIPRARIPIYLQALQREAVPVRILSLRGREAVVDRELDAAGWLLFRGEAVGAVFRGNRGLVASHILPSTEALFLPLLPSPYMAALLRMGYRLYDFY